MFITCDGKLFYLNNGLCRLKNKLEFTTNDLICAVNSLYCGHPRDRELVSLIARVRNSGNLFQSNVCNLFLPGI